MRFDTPLAQQRWLDGYNVSGETIPPFACVQIVGAALESVLKPGLGSTRDVLLRISRPTVLDLMYFEEELDEATGELVVTYREHYATRGQTFGFTGPVPIPAGGVGRFTQDLPTWGLAHEDVNVFSSVLTPWAADGAGQWGVRDVRVFEQLYLASNTDAAITVADFHEVFRSLGAAPHLDAPTGFKVHLLSRHSFIYQS